MAKKSTMSADETKLAKAKEKVEDAKVYLADCKIELRDAKRAFLASMKEKNKKTLASLLK